MKRRNKKAKSGKLGMAGIGLDANGIPISNDSIKSHQNQLYSTISFTCCSCCTGRALEYFQNVGISAHIAHGNPHNLHVKMPIGETREFMKSTGFRPFNRKAKDKRAMYLVLDGAK